MAGSKDYSLSGIGSDVELGVDGPRVIVTAGNIEARSTDNTGYVKVIGAPGTNANDFVTYSQLTGYTTQPIFAEQFSSGAISGGLFTPTTGVSFTVDPGTGYVLNSGVYTRITWGSLSGACLFAGANYIGVNASGALVVSATIPSNNFIRLGYAFTNATNTAILTHNHLYDDANDYLRKLRAYSNEALGPLVGYGFELTEPSPLTLSLSAGEVWSNFNEKYFSTATTFKKIYYTTDNGWVIDTNNPNVVNVTQWNDITQPQATALVTISNNKYKKDFIIVDMNGEMWYVYGQAEYANTADSRAGVLPTLPSSLQGNIFYAAAIVIQKNAATVATGFMDLRPLVSRLWTLAASNSNGTVTGLSVTSANGFAGTVANPTTTPAITLSTTVTGVLVGNGTAMSAAVSGTDVKTVNGVSILGAGNVSVGTVTTTSVTTANGFAGTVANDSTTPAITISTTVTGILVGNGTSVAAAVSGTDIKTVNGTSIIGAGNVSVGTVTTTSVNTANGFAGTVANASTTPAITITTTVTGLLVGNGTSVAAAVSGTDVKTVNGNSLLGAGNVSVGTVTQVSVVTANGFAGTVATDTTTPAITITTSVTGVLYGNGTSVAAATFANLPIALYKENPSTPTALVTTGTNSSAIGSGATATAQLSHANGDGTDARIWGQKAYANGKFATAGDAQAGMYVLRNLTTTAAATDLFLDGTAATQRLVTPLNSVWTFSILVTARNTTTAQGAGYKFEGVVRKDGTNATIVFVGTPVKSTLGENNTNWDANLTVNTTNGDLRITVTGAGGQTIRWVAVVTTSEVTN